MTSSLPLIDDRDYRDLVDAVVEWIPVDAPPWTDFAESDPGVTLVELFAFLTESLLWQIDRRQRQRRRRRVALLVAGSAGLGALWWTSTRLRSRHQRSPGETSP